MSWQLGAFAVLAVGLFAGFAWYERTRPDARIVALVGTLAAFAALGRVAFAALPNVKPTTDIVLIAGFALGGAPGYVVGAVAALSSNLFFGQGPWTPWQMAGWGLVGIAGALLGRLTGRRIARLPLALIAFVLGFAFTALQDFGDWVTYSDHSLAQLLLYVGKGVGFDLVHAVSCLGFALLFGPALISMLARFHARLRIHWLPAGSSRLMPLLAVAVALSLVGLGARTRIDPAMAAARTPSPLQYLRAAQNPDGGFGMSPGQRSSTLASGWVAIALGRDGDRAGSSVTPARVLGRLARYLAAGAPGSRDAGSLERFILAAAAVHIRGFTPADVDGHNLVGELQALIKRDGSVAEQVNLTAFAVLALRAAHARVPARMVTWIAHQQGRDGGFGFADAPQGSDADDTGAALSALAGTSWRRVVRGAVAYLRAAQNRDGGFGESRGAVSNAQSTAFAVCGLLAAGVHVAALHRRSSRSPLAYLRGLTRPDGAVNYARGQSQTPVWVTAEAELALSRRTL